MPKFRQVSFSKALADISTHMPKFRQVSFSKALVYEQKFYAHA